MYMLYLPEHAQFYFQFSLKISEKSWITQHILLDAVSPFIAFHTKVCNNQDR